MKRTITRNQFLRSGQVTRRARIYGACGLAIALIAAMGALVVWAQPTLGTAERGDPPGRRGAFRQDPQDELKLGEFMQIKLLRSQNILEGLATRDFTMIKDAIREIHELTEQAKWQAVDSPEYRKLTEEFQTATDRLLKAAEKENLEGVALRFYDLSTRCIDCHEHLRSVGF